MDPHVGRARDERGEGKYAGSGLDSIGCRTGGPVPNRDPHAGRRGLKRKTRTLGLDGVPDRVTQAKERVSDGTLEVLPYQSRRAAGLESGELWSPAVRGFLNAPRGGYRPRRCKEA